MIPYGPMEHFHSKFHKKMPFRKRKKFSQDQKKDTKCSDFLSRPKIRYQMLSAYAIHMLARWITASQPPSLIKVGLTNWFALYLFLTIYLENHTIFQNYENL
jgi:hypothetical protein